VSNAGDINDDGIDDIVISSLAFDEKEVDKNYIIFGSRQYKIETSDNKETIFLHENENKILYIGYSAIVVLLLLSMVFSMKHK